jgi:hypothetical protein
MFRETLDALEEKVKSGTLTSKDVHGLKIRFTVHEAREETGFYRWVATR